MPPLHGLLFGINNVTFVKFGVCFLPLATHPSGVFTVPHWRTQQVAGRRRKIQFSTIKLVPIILLIMTISSYLNINFVECQISV